MSGWLISQDLGSLKRSTSVKKECELPGLPARLPPLALTADTAALLLEMSGLPLRLPDGVPFLLGAFNFNF